MDQPYLTDLLVGCHCCRPGNIFDIYASNHLDNPIERLAGSGFFGEHVSRLQPDRHFAGMGDWAAYRRIGF
jgi:hypothetical protein